MTRVLVAAIAASVTVISAPASAQNYKCAPCTQGKPCPAICFPTPPKPPPPKPPVYRPAPHTQQVHPSEPPQQVYPRQVYRHLCVVPGVGSCEALGVGLAPPPPPGSDCECLNDLGHVFRGIVRTVE